MSDIYKKMDAVLVGEVDETLQLIARDLTEQNYGFYELSVIGEKLKNALLTAESVYLDENEKSS